MKQVDLIVFDLDNTLYDWYSTFIPAFYEMVDVACRLLGANRDALLDELQKVHRTHHDVEHPFSLLETQMAQRLIAKKGYTQAKEILDPAFHAFNKVRKRNLSLFPNTMETLDELRAQGAKLIAFTDSKYYSTLGRVERMKLTDSFVRIYCRERSPTSTQQSDNLDVQLIEKVRELPAHEAKPDPQVILDIAKQERVPISRIAYVGDSLAKDVLMAKRAGCLAIWAKYGAQVDPETYAKLIRISHWTSGDIAREKSYSNAAKDVAPDYICEHSIAEILSFVSGPEHRQTVVFQR
ncbi:hypothetical protein DNX69_01690 [Rhodopseudomonas palustris]|uniref:phosphoglycolate phosphatase n=1 Tax=Rhodopseudomonas palustris TaxID=1076 RepID=A0A323UMD3_RHOPL|nr:HAD family hydrolase [Rhodopseudomonas palustris]PZA13795.1 hypothetical protein DNX69_01690 [Rhodopseudomonas palustris]